MILLYLSIIFSASESMSREQIKCKEFVNPQEKIFYYDIPEEIGLDDITLTYDDHNFEIKYYKKLESEDKKSCTAIEGRFSEFVHTKLKNGYFSIKNKKLIVCFENGDEKEFAALKTQN